MAQSELNRSVEPVCEELATRFGFELVDVELVKEGSGKYLRIYIDKPGGITLQDCESYHHEVIPMVEAVDYDFLEVCSPGLDRPLKKQKDYDRHAGEQVEIHLYKPVDKCKLFTGELVGLNNGIVTIMMNGTERSFAQKDVAQCRLSVVITEEDLIEPDDADAESDEGELTDGGEE